MNANQDPATPSDEPPANTARLGADISDAVASMLRDALGRGPKRTRTYVHEDVILCVLGESLSTLEQTLVDDRRETMVTRLRDELHETLSPKATAIVESLTGRRVVATLADHHAESDAGAFVFVLEPATGPASA